MPSDDHAQGETPSRPAVGFDQYADDTPRGPYDPIRASSGVGPAAWGDELAFTPRPEATERTLGPSRRRPVLLASLGLLGVTLAIAGGIMLQRDRLQAPPAAAPRPMEAVQVEVRTPAEADASAQIPGAPLPAFAPAEVAVNAAPPGLAVAPSAPPAPQKPQVLPRYVDAAASAPAAARAPEVESPEAPAIPVAAPIQASFDCRRARSFAEEAVCRDPELAAADRRMSRAYRAALAADADPEDLSLEQADWVEAREDAARRSPEALMNIYRQRIADLRAWAETPPD